MYNVTFELDYFTHAVFRECAKEAAIYWKNILIVKKKKPNLTTFPCPHPNNVTKRVTLFLKTNQEFLLHCDTLLFYWDYFTVVFVHLC